MHSVLDQQTKTTPVKAKERFIFVLQLHSGEIVIGTASNLTKRITAINSGFNAAVPKSLQVNRIIGIKPVTAERNTVSVFKTFEAHYGSGSVIAV